MDLIFFVGSPVPCPCGAMARVELGPDHRYVVLCEYHASLMVRHNAHVN